MTYLTGNDNTTTNTITRDNFYTVLVVSPIRYSYSTYTNFTYIEYDVDTSTGSGLTIFSLSPGATTGTWKQGGYSNQYGYLIIKINAFLINTERPTSTTISLANTKNKLILSGNVVGNMSPSSFSKYRVIATTSIKDINQSYTPYTWEVTLNSILRTAILTFR